MTVTVMGYAYVTGTADTPMAVVAPVMSVMAVNGWVLGMTDSLDHRMEPTMGMGMVLDHTGGTIGFFQRVSPIQVFSVGVFVLRFLIACVRIVYSVFEFVEGWALKKTYFRTLKNIPECSEIFWNIHVGPSLIIRLIWFQNFLKRTKGSRIILECSRTVYIAQKCSRKIRENFNLD